MNAPRWIDGAAVAAAVGHDRAWLLLKDALIAGLDPAQDPPRSGPHIPDGQFLLMPSATATAAGVKVLSVAPENPEFGLPRIQGWYLLMDRRTLTPHTLLDAGVLTSIRTPAVSMVGVDALAPEQVTDAVIFGNGLQAVEHVRALAVVRPPQRLWWVGRDQTRLHAAVTAAGEVPFEIRPIPTSEADPAVRASQVVLCCTSANRPLFAGDSVADGACVVAVGSHTPDARELDGTLMGRAQVVVEDRGAALREAGDVLQAIAAGVLTEDSLHTMAELARGQLHRAKDRPNVFKTVGMAWQDLVIAEAVQQANP